MKIIGKAYVDGWGRRVIEVDRAEPGKNVLFEYEQCPNKHSLKDVTVNVAEAERVAAEVEQIPVPLKCKECGVQLVGHVRLLLHGWEVRQ